MGVTDNQPGSTFDLTADLSGGVLNGPLGKLVARIIKSDVRKSVCNLAALAASGRQLATRAHARRRACALSHSR